MVVVAYSPAGTLQANTTTDATGRYDMALPSGSYRVLAYDPLGTYATEFANDAPSFEESPQITLTAGQTSTIDFAMARGFRVKGTATTGGGPGAGLIVSAYNLSGTRRGFTTTSGLGTFSLVLPAGSYKFVAYDDASNFAPVFFRNQTSFAEADIITVSSGTPSIDFFLRIGARVFGTVTDLDGAPLTNASVYAYTADGKFVTLATTVADGGFAMTLQPGSYRFVAIDNTFRFAAGFLGGAISFDQSPSIAVTAGELRNDLAFRLEPGGLIAGSVVDATTGKGIAGITVAAYNPDGTQRTFVTTDANGQYVLLLPSGYFRIAAFDNGLVYATQFYPRESSFARSTGVSPTVGQSMTLTAFTLSHGGLISGTVTDQTTHAAIADAIVIAYDSAGVATGETTGLEDGTYRMVLPAGSYRLVATDPEALYAPGYSGLSLNFDRAAEITVMTDSVTKSDFALRRGTLVTGSVADTLNQPAAGVMVTFLDLVGNRVASVTSGSDGGFRIALVAGAYKIFLHDPTSHHYATAYFGGDSFSTASVFVVDVTGAPRLSLVVPPFSRRRAVSH